MLESVKSVLLRRAVGKAGRNAVRWLDAHEQGFRISCVRNEGIPWQIKPIGELILLLVIFRRHGIRTGELDRLNRFALAEAETFDWHELAAFDPSAATPMALVAEFFALENRPPPFETAYFDFLRGIDFFEGMDRVPYREMDLAYCYSRIGVPDQQPRLNHWFASTTFGRGQNLARYTIDDLYSLTHAIFYLTDVGCRPPAGQLDPALLARLHRELAALTAIMMRADNVDVLGELLLCWIFCGLVPTPRERTIFAAGLERMLASVTPDGAVAPMGRIKKRSEAGEATFSELYHTTLVGAILFSLVAKGRR